MSARADMNAGDEFRAQIEAARFPIMNDRTLPQLDRFIGIIVFAIADVASSESNMLGAPYRPFGDYSLTARLEKLFNRGGASSSRRHAPLLPKTPGISLINRFPRGVCLDIDSSTHRLGWHAELSPTTRTVCALRRSGMD